MDALEAILTRRSISRFRQDPVPKEMIEQLLEAAVRAPNHYITEPWRFVVHTGEARQALGEVFADVKRAKLADPDSAEAKSDLDKERARAMRSPVLIAVGIKKSDNPKAMQIEDIEAGAAAVENILIAANALGLGASWKTGDAAYDDRLKKHLGLAPDDHVAGLIHVGFPDSAGGSPSNRANATTLTQWRWA